MDQWKNQLYFGDNLEILREHIPVGSVDLIYLDPPFNSKNASRQRKGPAPEDSQGNLLEEARRPFGAGSGLINS